jgi:hypothetical protein
LARARVVRAGGVRVVGLVSMTIVGTIHEMVGGRSVDTDVLASTSVGPEVDVIPKKESGTHLEKKGEKSHG